MSEASAMRSECAQTTQVRFTRACRQQKAQVNAHIDADLKKAGDAGLAEAGYTPTQAIGALSDREYYDQFMTEHFVEKGLINE